MLPLKTNGNDKETPIRIEIFFTVTVILAIQYKGKKAMDTTWNRDAAHIHNKNFIKFRFFIYENAKYNIATAKACLKIQNIYVYRPKAMINAKLSHGIFEYLLIKKQRDVTQIADCKIRKVWKLNPRFPQIQFSNT